MSRQINKINRKNLLHLYNRDREGLGTYDVNYINAYKRELAIKRVQQTNQRQAA